MAILDTGSVVHEEIKTDIIPNTDYIITVTVTTDSDNISSNTTARYMSQLLPVGHLSISESGES